MGSSLVRHWVHDFWGLCCPHRLWFKFSPYMTSVRHVYSTANPHFDRSSVLCGRPASVWKSAQVISHNVCWGYCWSRLCLEGAPFTVRVKFLLFSGIRNLRGRPIVKDLLKARERTREGSSSESRANLPSDLLLWVFLLLSASGTMHGLWQKGSVWISFTGDSVSPTEGQTQGGHFLLS